eukprot:jgi/Mesvir1/15076/Mv14720-RA.1
MDAKRDEVKTFRDVTGCDVAKEEGAEFVDFLRDPGRYRELGARIPRGALLTGPPGTGETWSASMYWSDFMQMYVRMVPARVRKVFADARARAPSIIFIDEIDAIGCLLVEMDGFSSTSNVIVLASTNRPEVLDKALTRPGRFDRKISIDTPDIKGREQKLRIYLGRLKLDEVRLHTARFAGANVRHMCNEAAILEAHQKKRVVGKEHFDAAYDRITAGLEKKHAAMSHDE